MSKLLILDGIGGIPLGLEIHEAFQTIGVETGYCNLAKQAEIAFYPLRSAYAKAVNKTKSDDGFLHLPSIKKSEIESLLKEEKPTHILVIGFVYKFIDPSWLRQLAKKQGIHLYLYDTDSCNLYSKRREFIFFLDNELPIYDRIFSFSNVTTQFFRNTRNLNAEYFPFGAKPIDLPAPSAEQHNVLFVGSGDLRRIFLLEHIHKEVAIYGNRWYRNYPLVTNELKSRITDRSIWGRELHQLFADSKIILNITRTQFYGAETGINLRIFEALAAGRFLLTDYCDEVAELFEPGMEIETFKGSKELVEKTEYYLTHEDERLAIASKGHARFVQEFSWEARVKALSSAIGLTVAA